MALRPYQIKPVSIAVDFFRKPTAEPSLMVLPTAWGKSWLAAYVAKSILDGDSLLVLQPSKELLEQNYNKYITLCGDISDAAIYSASMRKKNIAKITFATIGSIKKKGAQFKELGFTKMLIDEAHLYPRKEESMIGTFLAESGITHVLGITATPMKMETIRSVKRVQKTDSAGVPIFDQNGNPIMKKVFDGYSMQVILTNPSNDGMFYNEIIHVSQIQEIIQLGFWSPLIYDAQAYDEKRLILNSAGTEFTEKSMLDAYTLNGVHDRIIAALKYYATRKHCVAFVPSVEEAALLASQVPDSACVSALTPSKERANIIDDFRSGNIRVVFNVNVLSCGFDYPDIDLIVLGFATASIAKYYQAVGRGVRKKNGKENCMVIDMCGNVRRFGKVEHLRLEKDGIWRLVGSRGNILTGIPIRSIGKYSISDLQRIEARTTPLPSMLPFGKYKNVDFSEVPPTYLQWMLEKICGNPESVDYADAIRIRLENGIHDTTGEPPVERMPYGTHCGKLLTECPRGYLYWFYENTKWNDMNDSLKRGVEKALNSSYQQTLFD